MFVFILVLSILFALLSFGGAITYLILIDKAFILTQKAIFEQAFVRCFKIFLVSLFCLIASCSAMVFR